MLSSNRISKSIQHTLLLLTSLSLTSLPVMADQIYANDDYRTAAMAVLGRGKNSDALALLSKAITKSPKDAELYMYRSDCYLRLNNPRKALADIQKAFELKKSQTYFPPVDSTFYLNRGYVYLALKRDAEALADFQKAVDIFGLQEGAHLELAKLYQKKGQLRLAFDHLAKVKEIQKSEKRSTAKVDKEMAVLAGKLKKI